MRNLRSGDVELLASGSAAAIAELIRRCWDGPPSAAVSDIVVDEAEDQLGVDFVVSRTE
jgi:acylphosphatase